MLVTIRQARKIVRSIFGNNTLYSFRYAPGSRTVGDMLESILRSLSAGEREEATVWRNEIRALVPRFSDPDGMEILLTIASLYHHNVSVERTRYMMSDGKVNHRAGVLYLESIG